MCWWKALWKSQIACQASSNNDQGPINAADEIVHYKGAPGRYTRDQPISITHSLPIIHTSRRMDAWSGNQAAESLDRTGNFTHYLAMEGSLKQILSTRWKFKGLRCRNHNTSPRVVPTVDNEVTFFSKKTPQYPIPCGKKRAMWDVSPLLDGPTCYCDNGPHHKVQQDEVHCFRMLFCMTNLKVNKGWMRIKLMWDTNC